MPIGRSNTIRSFAYDAAQRVLPLAAHFGNALDLDLAAIKLRIEDRRTNTPFVSREIDTSIVA